MLKKLRAELRASEVHRHTCSLENAASLIDSFTGRLDVLENEAQDLVELQEFLETSLVDFGLLRKWVAARAVNNLLARLLDGRTL